MKAQHVCALMIALFFVISLPDTFAQNGKNKGKQKTEKVTRAKKVDVPATPVPPDAPVPPGQVDKKDPNDKTQGYEKTAGIGEKKGWDKQVVNSKAEKQRQKELKKAEKKRMKEMRKAEKDRLRLEKESAVKARERQRPGDTK